MPLTCKSSPYLNSRTIRVVVGRWLRRWLAFLLQLSQVFTQLINAGIRMCVIFRSYLIQPIADEGDLDSEPLSQKRRDHFRLPAKHIDAGDQLGGALPVKHIVHG